MTDDARDLLDIFRAARAVERPDAPPFRRVVEGRSPNTRRRRALVPGLLLAGGAIAVVVAMTRLGRTPDSSRELELARRVMAWRSPTEFLLPASQSGLLSSVPRIGAAPPGSPLEALDPGNTLGPRFPIRSPRS
jgi:hypothetical protein